MPALVTDPSLLPATNGLLDSTSRIARLLGPGLVVLLAGWLPLAHFLTLDAATFMASAVAIWADRPVGELAASALPATTEGVGAAVARGFLAMRRHALLGYMLVLSTFVVNGTWCPAMFLGLPLAIEHLGVRGPGSSGLGAYGLVISAYGCTNLLATLVVGNLACCCTPEDADVHRQRDRRGRHPAAGSGNRGADAGWRAIAVPDGGGRAGGDQLADQ